MTSVLLAAITLHQMSHWCWWISGIVILLNVLFVLCLYLSTKIGNAGENLQPEFFNKMSVTALTPWDMAEQTFPIRRNASLENPPFGILTVKYKTKVSEMVKQ
jgi:hypothetical protein